MSFRPEELLEEEELFGSPCEDDVTPSEEELFGSPCEEDVTPSCASQAKLEVLPEEVRLFVTEFVQSADIFKLSRWSFRDAVIGTFHKYVASEMLSACAIEAVSQRQAAEETATASKNSVGNSVTPSKRKHDQVAADCDSTVPLLSREEVEDSSERARPLQARLEALRNDQTHQMQELLEQHWQRIEEMRKANAQEVSELEKRHAHEVAEVKGQLEKCHHHCNAPRPMSLPTL